MIFLALILDVIACHGFIAVHPIRVCKKTINPNLPVEYSRENPLELHFMVSSSNHVRKSIAIDILECIPLDRFRANGNNLCSLN